MAEDCGWTQTVLAQQLGCTDKYMSQLINGKVPLSIDAAHRLERVVGGSSKFWLSREANYQNHKTRIEAAQKHQP
jgi:HTH-type transcriptional regulator/antitoxin HigA